MLEVSVQDDALLFGEGFALDFQRTLRIPDDGKTYPLPPGLGTFPICKIEDYRDRVPGAWVERGGVFIPMYQCEALWISFRPRPWKPNAVKIAVGKVNAVSGKRWKRKLLRSENDYLVCPPQPWLDGINAGAGTIRQFVAMPLGMGYTVEAQVTGKEEFGGIQIVVYEPKPGLFPDEPPVTGRGVGGLFAETSLAPGADSKSAEMGLAAGGKMKQKIYPDPHGRRTWDGKNYGQIDVHIVNSALYREITGVEPPPTPISAQTYADYGLPWFDLYDDHLEDVAAPDEFKEIKSIKELDEEQGLAPQQDEPSIDVSEDQVIKYEVDS